MNEVVAVMFVVGIGVMIGLSQYKNYKDKKAFRAAQEVIKNQIAALEKKLAALKK